jgi:hypothetical protein
MLLADQMPDLQWVEGADGSELRRRAGDRIGLAAERLAAHGLPFEQALGRVRPHRGRRHRAERDARFQAALEADVEHEADRNAYHRDLHGATPSRLQEGGGRARRQRGQAHPGQQLFRACAEAQRIRCARW